VPKEPNAFRYKFSWAPAGVLKALRSPSRSLRHFTELRVARPWDAISRYDAPLPVPESFEVYPNRDSYPFMEEYRFEPHWKVQGLRAWHDPAERLGRRLGADLPRDRGAGGETGGRGRRGAGMRGRRSC
jgi:hypothetical protein